MTAAPSGVTWLIFVDDLHIDFRNTGYLRRLLQSIGSELIRAGDVFALESAGPSSVSVALTADRSRLHGQVHRMAGNGLKSMEVLERAPGPDGHREIDYRFRLAVTAATRMLDSLPPWPARRRAMLYISNGYEVERATSRLAVLTGAARRANARIFAIDPRAIPGAAVRQASVEGAAAERHWSATHTSLHAVAQRTGGFAARDQFDVAQVMARIASAVRPAR